MKRYMSTTDDVGVVGKDVGRLDSIVVPWRRLSADPAQLAFGYGIGNVSHSALGHGFIGRHFQTFRAFADFTFSRLLLELGVLGVIGVLSLMWMIFKDSYVLSQRGQDLTGTLAVGWAGAVVVITLSTLYSEIIAATSLVLPVLVLFGIGCRGSDEATHSGGIVVFRRTGDEKAFVVSLSRIAKCRPAFPVKVFKVPDAADLASFRCTSQMMIHRTQYAEQAQAVRSRLRSRWDDDFA